MEPLGENELKPVRVSWIERALLLLATISVAFLCVLITLGVISRAVGVALVPDNVLVVKEMMVAVILLPLALLTAKREQIAVTIFTQFAGERLQRFFGLLGHLVGLVFVGALLWAAVRLLTRSLASEEYYYGVLNIPVWIGHAIFVLGSGAFVLRLIMMSVIDGIGLFSHRGKTTTQLVDHQG